MEQSKRQLERPGDMNELQGIDELAKIDLSNSVQFQVSLAVPASSDVLCARTSPSAISPYQWTAYRAGDPYTDHICRHDNDTTLTRWSLGLRCASACFNFQSVQVLQKYLSHNYRIINFWLSACVLPGETRQFPESLRCTAWRAASNQSGQVRSFRSTQRRVEPVTR